MSNADEQPILVEDSAKVMLMLVEDDTPIIANTSKSPSTGRDIGNVTSLEEQLDEEAVTTMDVDNVDESMKPKSTGGAVDIRGTPWVPISSGFFHFRKEAKEG